MSIKVMSLVWDSDLETPKKFIMLFYADRGSDEGENVWPSVATVARKTSYTTRTVQLVTKQLVSDGLLVLDGKGPKGTNRYKINVDAVKSYRVPAKPTGEIVSGGDDISGGENSSGVKSTTENDMGGVKSTAKRGEESSPEPLLTAPFNTEPSINGDLPSPPVPDPFCENHEMDPQPIPEPTKPRRTAAVKKGDLFDGMMAYAKPSGETDVSAFPEDVHSTIREFCRLWSILPPRKTGKKGGEFALWIDDARMLQDACGELGLAVLAAVHADWSKDHPYTVGRPGSLIKTARAKAGEMRQKSQQHPKSAPQGPTLTPEQQAEWDRIMESRRARGVA